MKALSGRRLAASIAAIVLGLTVALSGSPAQAHHRTFHPAVNWNAAGGEFLTFGYSWAGCQSGVTKAFCEYWGTYTETRRISSSPSVTTSRTDMQLAMSGVAIAISLYPVGASGSVVGSSCAYNGFHVSGSVAAINVSGTSCRGETAFAIWLTFMRVPGPHLVGSPGHVASPPHNL